MTIVEAGALGVPSFINKEGIGAAQLLRPSEGAAIAVDVEKTEAVATLCIRMLASSEKLARIGRTAYAAATSWEEMDHVNSLLQLVDVCRRDGRG